MKNTPLTSRHIALGAKMAEFAGYNMPIVYSSLKDEHFAVRNNVGIFDVSHMGEFIVKGKEALALIQQVTSNDASKLAIGQAQYSCLPNHEGGIVDDLLVYRLDEDQCAEGEQSFMLVVNASNIDKDWDWINGQNTFDTRMVNISDQTGLLAVQGPKAIEVLQTLTDVKLADIPYYHFTKGRIAGLDNVIISATGYTGAGGFELYCREEDTPLLWDAVLEAGKSLDIQPAGLGARDTLRLEMGFCLYGNDIDDTSSPLEAGLGWITKLKKGKFNSSEIFTQQAANGVTRKLAGFIVQDRRIPRHEYMIEDVHGNPIGVVTSGTHSPSLDVPIGLGYLPANMVKPGTEIYVVAGNKRIKAVTTKLPFYSVG